MRKKTKIALLIVAAVVAVAVGFAGYQTARLHYLASRPDVDVNPANWDWPAGISGEEADRLAAEVLAEMTFEEKVFEMAGQGMSRMIATIILDGYRAVVYAGGNERLKIPPLAFADGATAPAPRWRSSTPASRPRASTVPSSCCATSPRSA